MTSRHDHGGPGDSGESRRRKSLGRAGESVAQRFLEKNGFLIIEENYRLRAGEIDIIALKDRMLIFCEVKTRLDYSECVAEDYSETQQRRMVGISEEFLVRNENRLPRDYDVRYDLIVVGDGPGGVLEVKDHITDAFRPT